MLEIWPVSRTSFKFEIRQTRRAQWPCLFISKRMSNSNALSGGEGGGVAVDTGGGGRVQQKFRFNDNDDILLLKQVNASRPYRAGYGKVMAAWSDLASVLVSQAKRNVTTFRPTHVDGKAVQSRFIKLIKDHRKFNVASERKSGSSEEESELTILLDDVMADYDDFQEESAKIKASSSIVDKGKEVCMCYYCTSYFNNFKLSRSLDQLSAIYR